MMKHAKTEALRRAYRAYKNSPYSGFNGRIIGFNSQFFSFGFIGEINEKEAFFLYLH